MATTIQIAERTKDMLDKLKIHRRQSYNEIIESMAEDNLKKSKKKSIMHFAGIWKDIDEEEIERMKKNIVELRNRSTKELLAH